jgi:uncharacterized membrane protein YgaE (UPF0421/DUF939 family)
LKRFITLFIFIGLALGTLLPGIESCCRFFNIRTLDISYKVVCEFSDEEEKEEKETEEKNEKSEKEKKQCLTLLHTTHNFFQNSNSYIQYSNRSHSDFPIEIVSPPPKI